jgi:hypothetical protein
MSSIAHADQDTGITAVLVARASIVQALGPLAASPLDIPAAARMRRTLQRANTPQIRIALRRMTRPPQTGPAPAPRSPRSFPGPARSPLAVTVLATGPVRTPVPAGGHE